MLLHYRHVTHAGIHDYTEWSDATQKKIPPPPPSHQNKGGKYGYREQHGTQRRAASSLVDVVEVKPTFLTSTSRSACLKPQFRQRTDQHETIGAMWIPECVPHEGGGLAEAGGGNRPNVMSDSSHMYIQHRHSTCAAQTQHRYSTNTAHAQHRHSTDTAQTQHMHSTGTAQAQHRHSTDTAQTHRTCPRTSSSRRPGSRPTPCAAPDQSRIGHNIGLQAPISTRSAWERRPACPTARVGWASA